MQSGRSEHQVVKQIIRSFEERISELFKPDPDVSPVITIVEHIEKSYYRQLLAVIADQLQQLFNTYEKKKLNHFMGIYLCTPD
ncbi:MAG: hypothetical protein FH756_09955 [Firmicutes bacterium]|nr:hypothetical protein [Bacillota bacterium]